MKKTILLAIFALPCVLSALTIDEAIQSAIANYPTIKSKLAQLEATKSDIDAAKWQRWPSVYVSTQSNGYSSNDAYKNDKSITYTIDQPLFTGWKISSLIDEAQAKSSSAEFGLSESKKDISIKITEVYANCLRLQQRVTIATENVKEHKRLYEMVKNRLLAGSSSEADVALANSRLKSSQTELVQLNMALKNSLRTLSLLTNKEDIEPIDFKETLEFKNADEAVALALQNSPTLSKFKEEVSVALAQKENKKSVLYPQVFLRYEKTTGYQAQINTDTTRAYVALTFQPGSGLSSYSYIEGASQKVLSAKSDLESAKLDLTDKVTTQYGDAYSYTLQLSDMNENAYESKKVADSYERQFTLGKKSWLDLLNSKREATQSGYSLVDTKINAAAAIRKLKILTSKEQ